MRKSFTAQAGQIARRGFTLTELLLVIIIIAILAAMTMAVQRSAVQSTRRERTIATIRKIDAALTSAYEKYQYRKLDVNYFVNNIKSNLINGGTLLPDQPRDIQNRIVNYWVLRTITMNRQLLDYADQTFSTSDPTSEPYPTADEKLAPYILRTIMLRELLTADFPDCIQEVELAPQLNHSPVHLAYQQYYDVLLQTAENSKDGDVSADLLYLIVMNTSPETRGAFLDRETVDTNGNGIPEFVDGWGNPIRFIRWAPAVENTNRQPTPAEGARVRRYRELKRLDASGYELDGAGGGYEDELFFSESRGTYPASDYDFFTYFEEYYPGLLEMAADPFDPMESMSGWLLTPLIYSAGPDKEYGMEKPPEEKAPIATFPPPCPSLNDAAELALGLAKEDGTGDDNITNHNLE